MADPRLAQIQEINQLQQRIEDLQQGAAAREEQKSEVPPWLLARKWLIAKGLKRLPRSKRGVVDQIQASDSLRQQLCFELPKVAEALAITDEDTALPEIVCELLSDPSIEPSVQLGRRLLDSGPIDQLISMAPGREATIRLAVRAWRNDQRDKMHEGIEATREAAAKAKAADQQRIRQHGNPLVRASTESQELRKREVLRQAGIKVGHRH